MHYVAYLDEFGHIGPYISRSDLKYNDSPVFGFGGFIIPVECVREFAIYFYQLKCKLLAWEMAQDPSTPSYQWEKKGSQLYTEKNVTKYPELKKATFRLFNHIEKIGGFVFYTGEHKTTTPFAHNSAAAFTRQLLQAIRKIDQFCNSRQATFLLILDQQDAGDKWRENNVKKCTLAMFEDTNEKCRALIEPPIQAESHLFQTLQCADWICGITGRLAAYKIDPVEYPEFVIFHKYFYTRFEKIMISTSGLEHQKTIPPATDPAAEALPDALGELAGTPD